MISLLINLCGLFFSDVFIAFASKYFLSFTCEEKWHNVGRYLVLPPLRRHDYFAQHLLPCPRASFKHSITQKEGWKLR